MIRVLAFMVRRPDLTRDQFRDHYERTHVPTALPILAGTTHYVRHHIREELFGRPNFDCMSAFEYRDAAAMHAVFAKSEGAGGRGRTCGCMCTSSGSLSPLRRLQGAQEATTFSQTESPPRLRGTTWSSVRRPVEPQYWQRQPSRAKSARREIRRCTARGTRT